MKTALALSAHVLAGLDLEAAIEAGYLADKAAMVVLLPQAARSEGPLMARELRDRYAILGWIMSLLTLLTWSAFQRRTGETAIEW